ncbi:isoamyl acetate-hydrolyzing esterase 1 homolog isoform X1 [Microtus oregoni]|uniref:isoamyl acetate-hydrolyzing esterase 1 homolog isoform X1 n=1 Tax=Microtus oregoni TaxID=111838 RepID=UPI001BB1C3D7|nr:isoamyl acetate-hydrolyzing esterase 1 homolog isoform X1 [Microtus oregoni]
MALCERVAGGSSLLWPRVLLFGDSITQFSFQPGGWGALLADRLVRKCDVLNRGFSGYNTRWAKIILPRLIRKENSVETPVAVTVFFGANDSSLQGENPKQHVPLDEYRANLRDMVQYLTSAGIPQERVILITPPPLHEAAWEKECILKGCKLNRLNAVVGEYANACVQAARDCGTDVLDLWTLMQKDNQVLSFSQSFQDHRHKAGLLILSIRWPAFITSGKRVSVLKPLAAAGQETLLSAMAASLLEGRGGSKARAESARGRRPLVGPGNLPSW